MSINTSTFNELKDYYDKILNLDKSTYTSSNDEPTPISCISEMISKIPEELWMRKDLSILDRCCGNGNFNVPIYFELLKYNYTQKYILDNVLEFNDINESRLDNVRRVFGSSVKITNHDFLNYDNPKKYDLIVANPLGKF